MARRREDKEIKEFAEAMIPPERAESGFGAKTIVGAIVLGVFMLPGTMYMQLFMGAGLGPAAQWVTVILFAEVARRSLKNLRQQEVFILFYLTGISMVQPFQTLLWRQYLVQSDVALGMGLTSGAAGIPAWFAPSAEQIDQVGNTFFSRIWILPIALFIFQMIMTRVNGFGIGYVLYRLTAHGEKLPFPLAPVSAQGILALSEEKGKRTRWRWRAFSTGGMLGMGFGFIYIGIPSITGSLFGQTYQVLPIPWLDLCATTERVLPATATNLVFDLGLVILGMVLPFWAVVGGFCGLLITLIANPILYKMGILVSWQEGMKVVDTQFHNHLDFYLPFTIGLTLAIFIVSIAGPLFRAVRAHRELRASNLGTRRTSLRDVMSVNRLRGDISIWIGVAAYAASTLAAVVVCAVLIPDFPWWWFAAFGFIYTPVISYVNAKLEGLVGQQVTIPLVREAAFILSGYKGAAIWFAPIPIVNYGVRTRQFRVMELTGTRVSGIIKTEAICLPIVIVGMVVFAQFIWRLGPIPSEAYPFTQEVWRQQALNHCVTYTATMEGGSKFLEALDPAKVGLGMGAGLTGFAVLSLFGLPTLLVYGVVRGLSQTTPGHVLPEFIGCLIGRFYFRRKFGVKEWRRRIPVVLAGYTCGVGLMAMASVGLALLWKSISALLY